MMSPTPPTRAQKRKPVPMEFWLYFALLFAIELPIAILRWTFHLAIPARRNGAALKSPVADAYARAWHNAPVIFSM